EHLVSIFKEGKTTEGKICIAEKRDAEVSILIPRDKMAAHLTILKPQGGKPATLDMVKQKLAEKGVRYGFLPQAIKTAILSGEADELLIAQGEPGVDGEDAKFTCLIKNMKIRTPKISEDGHVDYRDLGEIQVVHANEKLMRRDPATMGTPSKNIFGEVINPRPGKDIKFAAGLEGVKTSPENFNILIATVTGQPIVCENGVNVEKTMKVENVDLKSGNIIFDGSIIVDGDVTSGMKVKASGDIKIKGMVENAVIEAGGDINIKGAVVGRSENNAPVSDDLVKIEALGSVSAKFIENAHVSSGNKIMVQDWVIKSTLHSTNEIIVGKKDATKGQIVGGSITSGILIKAMNIGSSAGATTHIQVGDANDIEKEKDKLGVKISQKSKALFELQKVFKDLKNNPTNQAKETLKKALRSKQQYEHELVALRSQEAILDTEKKRAQNAKIIVEKKVYSGTSINISQYNKDIQDDLSGRTFATKDGKIIQIT
ncbi:MAG: FapA family protein, partial [Gammaproteobacteria bacterium]|nr:FapA family protein [Gammaproteobacteria bacterium]